MHTPQRTRRVQTGVDLSTLDRTATLTTSHIDVTHAHTHAHVRLRSACDSCITGRRALTRSNATSTTSTTNAMQRPSSRVVSRRLQGTREPPCKLRPLQCSGNLTHATSRPLSVADDRRGAAPCTATPPPHRCHVRSRCARRRCARAPCWAQAFPLPLASTRHPSPPSQST
jgi:hypothetical protein